MNKSKKILAAVILLILSFIIFLLFNSKKPLVRQMQGPVEGTDSITSFGNNLSIISKNNHIYTWQWDNLKKWPIVAKPNSEYIQPLNDNKIVYVAKSELVLTDLKAEKDLLRLSMPYDSESKKITASENGKIGLIALAQKDNIQLALFDSELKELKVIFEKNTDAESFTLLDFTINNDSNLLVGAGKKDKAWIFAKDIKNDKILWEKNFDDYGQFTIVKFSPDGKTIYAAEKIRFIVCLDSNTGQILKTYEMPAYNTPANQKQNISAIAISPDGKTFAADTEPAKKVWFWDIASGNKIGEINPHDFTVADIAFSPDSKCLATGCLVKPEIRIWKVPQLKK